MVSTDVPLSPDFPRSNFAPWIVAVAGIVLWWIAWYSLGLGFFGGFCFGLGVALLIALAADTVRQRLQGHRMVQEFLRGNPTVEQVVTFLHSPAAAEGSSFDAGSTQALGCLAFVGILTSLLMAWYLRVIHEEINWFQRGFAWFIAMTLMFIPAMGLGWLVKSLLEWVRSGSSPTSAIRSSRAAACQEGVQQFDQLQAKLRAKAEEERIEAARQAEEARRTLAATEAAAFKERLKRLTTGGGILAGSTAIGGLAFKTMDLRDKKEQAIELDAMAGSSLGEQLDALVNEVIRIGRSPGFLGETGGPFNENRCNRRCREIGLEIYELGGMELMQAVYYRIRAAVRNGEQFSARSLEHCWHEVGQWRS